MLTEKVLAHSLLNSSQPTFSVILFFCSSVFLYLCFLIKTDPGYRTEITTCRTFQAENLPQLSPGQRPGNMAWEIKPSG
jgi:hypothetical protein